MTTRRYNVSRASQDGASWSGVAEVVEGHLVETGAWTMRDGSVVNGRMEMVWGKGEDAGTLKVVQPHTEHEYLLVESDDGWVGQYECGDDMYYVWSEVWGVGGWEMRFEVEGPKKATWQEVVYTPLMSA